MKPALAAAIEQSEINYMLDRMQAIKAREGNPEGIEIKRFSDAIAFYSQTMPWKLFNNVKGSIVAQDIDAIIAFFEERNRDFEFQMIPSKVNPDVVKLLHKRSFYQSSFHTSLYTQSRPVELVQSEHMTIRELKADELDLYAKIHCLGTGLSLTGQDAVASNNEVLYKREAWRYYIGFYDEEPAAVAVMHMQDQMASLTFATTLPQYRQLGFHTLLLLQRIHDAYQHGCKLVIGQCAYCSPSHRNMERVGMRIGYTRSTWIKD